jgi:hypothetical protein
MDLVDLKKRIVGFAGRSQTALTQDGLDMVLAAINDARRQAQRSYNFQMLKKTAFIQTSAAGADYMSACVTSPGGATQVRMKLLHRCFVYTNDGGIYKPTARVPFDNVDDFAREVDAYAASGAEYPVAATVRAYVEGRKFYVYPSTTPAWYMVRGIEWLSDLTGDEVSSDDLFLEYFSDWLLLASVQMLNFYVKEDQRVAISDAAVGRLWNTVTFMDGQLGAQGEWTNLD